MVWITIQRCSNQRRRVTNDHAIDQSPRAAASRHLQRCSRHHRERWRRTLAARCSYEPAEDADASPPGPAAPGLPGFPSPDALVRHAPRSRCTVYDGSYRACVTTSQPLAHAAASRRSSGTRLAAVVTGNYSATTSRASAAAPTIPESSPPSCAVRIRASGRCPAPVMTVA